MLDDGEQLVPGFKQARALRVWTGVRPLFEDAKAADTDTRDVTRSHALLDHARARRRRALRDDDRRQAHDLPAHGPGHGRRRLPPARRAARRARPPPSPLPGSEDGEPYKLGDRLARKEEHLREDQLICECELIPRSRLEEAMRRRGTHNLDDIRRELRLGMGPCQGGFCIYRATGILHGLDGMTGEQANGALLRLPAGALEGHVADPLRRPAAPGAAGRLDLPGRPRRGAPAVMRGELHFDAVVIGAGSAGLTAATRLAEGGARVCVLAKGHRLDAPRARDGRRARLRARARGGARARAERARRRAPRPPLRAHGRRERRARAAVVRRAHRRRSAARLSLRRRPRAQPPAAHRGRRAAPVGARARDDGRGRHAHGASRCASSGTRALRDFHAALCAANLETAGVAARAIEVDLELDRADANALGLARRFDDPDFRAAFAAELTPPPARRRARRAAGGARPARPARRVGRPAAAPGPRRLRDPDAAAVGAGHARLRGPAHGAARAPAGASSWAPR